MSKPVSVCCICQSMRERLMVCGRCKAREYCSEICQGRDWKGGHKETCKSPTMSRREGLDAGNVFGADEMLLDKMAGISYATMSLGGEEDGGYRRVPVVTMINRPWEGESIQEELNVDGLERLAYVCVHRIRKETILKLINGYLRDGQKKTIRNCDKVPCVLLRVADTTVIGGVLHMRVMDTAQYHLWLVDGPHLADQGITSTMTMMRTNDPNRDRLRETRDPEKAVEAVSQRARLMLHELLTSKEMAESFMEGRTMLVLGYDVRTRKSRLASCVETCDSVPSALYRLAQPELVRGDFVRLMRHK